MAAATLNLNVIEKRMLNDAEAASYCGLPAKHFKAACPVQPVQLGGNALRYDKRDLDQWIDSEKSGGAEASRDDILRRLG
jgi:hypothetical protein